MKTQKSQDNRLENGNESSQHHLRWRQRTAALPHSCSFGPHLGRELSSIITLGCLSFRAFHAVSREQWIQMNTSPIQSSQPEFLDPPLTLPYTYFHTIVRNHGGFRWRKMVKGVQQVEQSHGCAPYLEAA